MKRLAVLSVAAVIGLGGILRPGRQGQPLPAPEAGAEWLYDAQGGQVSVKVDKAEKVGSDEGFKLVTSSNNKENATEVIVIKADGFYRAKINNLVPKAPIKFFQLPVKAGDSWKIDTDVNGQAIKGEFKVEEVKDLTLPGDKKYAKALLVTGTDFEIGGSKTTTKTWFVEGTGIVKMEFTLGSQDAKLELSKYTPGK